jgi:hypothetical protein
MSIHEGKFKLVGTAGTTIITRNKKLQVEENADVGVIVIYAITWIDNCTYEMRFKELIKGDPSIAGKEGDVLTIQIKKTKPNSYISVTTANFTKISIEREIEIL